MGIRTKADTAHVLRIGLVCVSLHMNSTELIKLLLKNGWALDRVKGSHHVYRHPSKGHAVTVPHPKKNLGIGLVKAIKKQAGIEEK